MSIELHCPQCGRLIKAPENAGGRHGKCPYCERKVYIPTPENDIEEIGLAPVDETEIQREARLRQEALEVAKTVMRDRTAVPEGETPDTSPGVPSAGADIADKVVDLNHEVGRFVLAMRDSKLDQAEKAVAVLARTGQRARDFVQGLMIDEIPPEFENVPPPLLKGFLKTLLGRLS